MIGKSLIILAAITLASSGVLLRAQDASALLNTPDFTAAAVTDASHADETKVYTGMPAVDAFINAPYGIFPTIDKMTRMDMADYFNSGSDKPSKNIFKGDCRILAASAKQVKFATSDVSEVELSLLPSKSDTIAMVITTLATPVKDSTIDFYTYPEWKPLATERYIMMPSLADWTIVSSTISKDDLENNVPFILSTISYAPETGMLRLSNNTAEYLSVEARKATEGALRPSLSYKWNGKRMEKK